MSDEKKELPRLLVSKAEAQKLIENQIEKGKILQNISITSERELKIARAEKTKWENYNEELLRRLFSNNTIAEQYSYYGVVTTYAYAEPEYYIQEYRDETFTCISRLESIVERLPLIPETNTISFSEVSNTKDIFIVHGHDDKTRDTVDSFIRQLGLNPIVLHKQANLGRTIIEKFEQESSPVGFAIILLTPDDVGAVAGKPKDLKFRARQNVILELGYFIGKLGRHRVCSLLKGDIEQPSDIFGMVYISMNNDWRAELKREMKAAGIQID